MLFDLDETPTDTKDAPEKKSLKKVYNVTELSSLLKGVVENHFTGIQIKAELSSVKKHSSGHIYFALKDDKSVLDGVCWKGVASRLEVQPQDGLEVICTGRLTTYPGRSKYQMVVESMEPAGEGALLKQLEALKKKLLNEGFFDPAHKKQIPFMPKRIGVITSPTGAVIRDILHRLGDRFPVPVMMWPVPVQGDVAAEKICAALAGFQKLDPQEKPDVIIVARGGGSLEDLWCFNDERVVRAVFSCPIPVISAVGHETDTTLIDFVSDHRAPTPTAAAERAVPVRLELLQNVKGYYRRLNQSMRRFFEDATLCLDDVGDRKNRSMEVALNFAEQNLERLRLRSPLDVIDRQSDLLSSLEQRLHRSTMRLMDQFDNIFKGRAQLLESYSYTRTLERGFSLVRDQNGHVVKSVDTLKDGDLTSLIFSDGDVAAKIIKDT